MSTGFYQGVIGYYALLLYYPLNYYNHGPACIAFHCSNLHITNQVSEM